MPDTTPPNATVSYVLDWPVWSNYSVDQDGWMYPSGERRIVRHGSEDLVNAFAAIHAVPLEQRPDALLEFVKKYGLLGQTRLGRPRRRADGYVFDVADDRAWALLHARNVHRILRLKEERNRKLDDLLALFGDDRTVRVRDIGSKARQVTHPLPPQVPTLAEPWSIRLEPDVLVDRAAKPLQVSRRLISHLLNPNTGSVPRVYDPVTDSPTFHFRTLIELVYWQLADALGRYQIRRCRCGALFFVFDGRQKAHSTRCFRRFYMRDRRKGKLRREKKSGTKKGRTA
jgi:hypothetical protein